MLINFFEYLRSTLLDFRHARLNLYPLSFKCLDVIQPYSVQVKESKRIFPEHYVCADLSVFSIRYFTSVTYYRGWHTFVNKVLLKHSHSHPFTCQGHASSTWAAKVHFSASFVCALCCLLCPHSRIELQEIQHGLQSLK